MDIAVFYLDDPGEYTWSRCKWVAACTNCGVELILVYMKQISAVIFYRLRANAQFQRNFFGSFAAADQAKNLVFPSG